MPVNTTAPVTARDHFVVAFTREELASRIAEFRDLSISDDDIRQRYFQRTRSARYETGDTRGWKLAEARRIVAADDNWQAAYRSLPLPPLRLALCVLAPRHDRLAANRSNTTLLHRAPLCLIARRQQLPTQPCTFFWISDGLALDGVIRSDNRGSESLFPLYLSADSQQANFAPGFVEQFATGNKAKLATAGLWRSCRDLWPGRFVGLYLRFVSLAELSREIRGGIARSLSESVGAEISRRICSTF